MRGSVRGEQYAQVDNPDPFASPVWRSPVYRTPEGVIYLVQLLRLMWRVLWFVIRHPGLDLTAGALLLVWANTGWQGLVTITGIVVTCLAALRLASPRWFTRLISAPTRDRWRWWCYRRRWQAVMTISRLAPLYQGRVLLPVLGRVASSRFTDRVTVGMVSGQSPKDFADRAEGLAHGFGVRQCRVRSGQPGTIVLELVRRDALAEPMPALLIPATVDLRALPVGRREDGSLLVLRLHGTHLLIAGATGAGKGSWLWGLIRAMLPTMAAGVVRVLACDPKLMELAFGRALFDRYGRYAADPADIAALLEEAVADMQARAARCAALTTQGRAAGYCVVAALQDPRKEVLNIRNLFPDKIALRLDEPSQTDLVLGDGARDRGALCDQISSDPGTGAGVGFIRLEADPDPVRVRAAFVSDDDIRAMAAAYAVPAWRAAPIGGAE